MQFDESFFDDALFYPGVVETSRQGSPILSHPGDGEPVRILVRPNRVTRVEPDGRVIAVTIYRVSFRNDPTPLNSGRGVRLDDKIAWGNVELMAQGPSYLPCTRADRMPVWRVDCLARE
jgi:hypothetical protein